ncbi:NADH-quinone oxidoreductase subunit L [Thiosulfativibrio zosterae]|uniref:Probable inorganic carbon transporter subunit DabB n=1 Tax=Thiosulfativibrio zosterae TaxID=2675053 RepID=A0A6F8PPV3_9GAMM|nr:NADH-quinone oxidoreductase subunit L [Thiosulfativibrio zosterae]BBP44135.1 NADH dehydrogenase subunit L [Thiosulfativibrio zosterae]
MNTPMVWSIMLYAIPLLFLMGAGANSRKVNWGVAKWVTQMALAISTIFALLVVLGKVSLTDVHSVAWLNPSTSSLVMLVLISFIALVNVRFSEKYMSGNAEEEERYVRWLMLSLGAVTLVVISNHLLVFMVAWIAISIGLHQLLVFYPQRQRAVLAAYKKFIFARLAEISLFSAILLLHKDTGSWLISDVYTAMSQATELNGLQEAAAILLALTALIKCAQLPLHGWLIQVVESPTPVSALLHAGIINLGGFLMILFAPLMIQSAIAQWLLLIVGGLTTVVAALIMMTKISVKVRLAWSTMSQMGLMLVECGLGLYELALLHLVAHSCYKAYAFLNSGSEVESDLKRRLALPKMPRAPQWISSFLIASGFVLGMIWVFDISAPYSPWLLLGIAMMILVAERDSRLQRGGLFGVLSMALILVAAYSLQKYGAGLVVQSLPDAVGLWGDIWMSALFITFMALYWILKYWPEHPKVMHFRVALYAGFYLDEWVTRVSLKFFPKRLPVRFNPKQLQIAAREMIQ